MGRTVAGIAAIVLLIASSRTNALGLGEIEVGSALNEPFRAVVELTSATDQELEELKISLAPREAFQRAGLARPHILSNFMFKAERTASGKPVIRISTRDAVDEPFLDFLLEVVWSKGRLVRQYTVLIDPPYTMPAAPVAPSAPVTQAQVAEPAPAPKRELSRPTPVAAPPPVSYPATAPASPPAPAEKPVADRYGPVQRSETLWQIAKKLRPDSEVSIQQMMLALQRSNPDAFTGHNINNLKTGVVLDVPDREAIVSMSRSEAIREARRQYEQWKTARKGQDTEPATGDTQQVATVATETRLQLVAPEEEIPEQSSEETAAPGLPEPGKESAAQENRDLQQQLAMATEEEDEASSRSGGLTARVTELEDQVARMQRMLELKDAQLASLQNRLDTENKTSAAQPEDTGTDTAQEQESDPASAASGAMEEPNDFLDRLLDNPLLTGLGVLVAMILGGFLWASTRQRRNNELFDDEPTLARRLSEKPVDEEPATPSVNISDNRLFGELPGDDISPLEGDAESDPLTEADVFIAYGRVQQAEDVVKNALKKSPENMDLKVKLMEVYHAAGNAAAFDTHAEGFRRLVDQDDPRWTKIASMGYDLSPENPAYKSAAAEKSDGDLDFGIDLSGMEDIEQGSGDEQTGDDESGLDYVDRDQAANDLPENVDFNLDELEQAEAPETGTADDQFDGILDDTDEVSTKLDLARAYIDMGDSDSARNILEEVLEEGDSEQKNEAENLVSQLA